LRRVDFNVSSLLKSSKISFTSRSNRRAKNQIRFSIDLIEKFTFNI
jgi:hypothetical protein